MSRLLFLLVLFSGYVAADSKLETAQNMCAEFAKTKPIAQRKVFVAECVQSMMAPKSVMVFADTEPIDIATVMSDGKSWFLQQFLKAKSAAFRSERLVKYTSYRPAISDSEARAKGLRIIPAEAHSRTLYYCGEVSTDGGASYRWFAVAAQSDSVGRKGQPVVFEPPPLKLMRWEDEKGICMHALRLS